jgi:beta-fructofuranosidase
VPHSHYIADLERVGLSLISYPYNISSVIDSELVTNSSLSNGTVVVDYSGVESSALYFEANITNLSDGSSLSSTFNFTFLLSVSG